MINFKAALRTTLLLVDDDRLQLELRALVLKMSGFSVLTASSPAEAISIVAQHPEREIDLAIVDYQMPLMNGCVLADYLKERYRGLKVILHSGEMEIPESEM